MEIYYFTPFASDKNLGAAYNRYMELIPNDEDWVCFTDADTMFLCPDFGQQILNVVRKYPEAGMFTCYTNRVGNTAQLYGGVMSSVTDIRYHRKLAQQVWLKNKTNVIRLSKPISGHMMIIRKGIWKETKFVNGLLGVDNKISEALLKKKLPVYLMKGVYLLHYYRMVEGEKFTKHLKK